MRVIILILFAVFLFGCKEETKISIPEHIINEAKLTEIIVDIQLAEAVFSSKTIKKHDDILLHYEYVFKKHNVSEKQYNDALVFYKNNPVLLDKIYESVIEKLSKIEAEEKGKKHEKPKNDQPKNMSMHDQLMLRVKQDSIRKLIESSDSKNAEQK